MKLPLLRLPRAAAILVGFTSALAHAQSDSFATPTAITSLPVTGTNAGATKETGEPAHGNNAGGASVWYSWTAPANAHYRVDLLNSSFDTLLGLYTGAAVDALTTLALDDDRPDPNNTGNTSTSVVYLRAGETILIAVDGYNAATGDIAMDIFPLPATEVPPPNDLFINAASLGNTATASATVTSAFASREVGEPLIESLPGNTSLWWTWTAPATASVTIDTVGSAYDTLLAVYTGSDLNALTLVASNNNDGTLLTSKVTIDAVAGTQYKIAADFRSTGTRLNVGNIVVRIGGGTGGGGSGPANDDFANATAITTLPLTGTNVGATKQAGEPNHGNNAGGSSVWYSWTATADGHYRVDLLNSTFDTLLGIYTGATVTALLPVTQNDDRVGGATTSQAVIYARTGQKFYIAVDGYKGTGTAATGNISLNISLLPGTEVPPANDLFVNAANLGAAMTASQSMSTVYGSREYGEPLIENVVGASSLWWVWTAPSTGEVEINTTGTTFNTLLAVYTGTAIDALTLVASNDNAPGLTTSRVSFGAVAGTEYRIAADVSTAAITVPSGTLNLGLSANIYVRTLFQTGSTWEWLHPAGGIDPAIADPDFNTTWYSSAAYNGPAFNTPGGGLLGYGGIDYAATVTAIGDPGSGNRYTAYFRRSFTAGEASTVLRADVIADDGAIFYIDGVERGRLNMDAIAADTFNALALTATGTETGTFTVDLGAITAGTHEIAVSVHNAGPTSSDLGFDMRLYTDNTPPPVDFILGLAGAFTGFEEPVAGSNSYLSGSNGTVEIGWTTTGGGTVRAPASHPTGTGAGAAPTTKYLSLNGARANSFYTNRIALSGLTAEQKGNIVASASVRTFTTSTTTFELGDDLTILLEGSTDGTVFNVLTEVLPFTSGGTPDSLFAISAATNDFVQFSTTPGAVPPTIAYVRLAITGGTDSTSEYIYVDNLRVAISGAVDPAADDDGDGQNNGAEAVAGTDPNDPTSVLRLGSATRNAGGLDLTFGGVAGKVYQVQYSATLSGAWTVLRDDITAAATGSIPVTGLVLPAGSAGFVRIKVKP